MFSPIGLAVDVDHTLLETEQFQYMAWKETVQYFFGIDLSKEDYIKEYCGYTSDFNAKKIVLHYGTNNSDDWKKIFTFRKNVLDNIMDAQSTFSLIPGAKEFLQNVIAKNLFVVLVTGGSRNESIQKFQRSELIHLLSKNIPIVTSDDYEQGKPYPEPYLLGKKKLIELSNDTIERFHAFEDSVPGMLSAIAAGYDTVHIIPHRWTKEGFSFYKESKLFPKKVKQLKSLANYKI